MLIKKEDRQIIITMKDLNEMILSEPLVSRVFNAGIEVFLVGGYLRDLLRGIRSKDIDFVVKGDLKSLLSRIFTEINGSIIEFKKAALVRVVVGDYILDFSELKGTLEDDLSRRDFTMNAIAWSAEKGIIDPLHGAFDIEKKIIRSISEKNFMDDPLRLLRAYRFAGELGWIIDEETRKIIRKLKNSIKQSATERITLEIFKLLNSNGSNSYLNALKTAILDGLLAEIISIDNNMLEYNLKAISRFDSFLKKIPEGFKIAFDKTFSQGLSSLGLLRAEQLLYGSNLERNNLRLSRAILKRLMVTAKLLKDYEKSRNMNNAKIFDLFTEAEDAAVDFALLTRRQGLLKKAERFMNIKPVLPAEKVMEITGLEPGPELGEVLNEMKRLQFLGRIKDENDARKWLSKRF